MSKTIFCVVFLTLFVFSFFALNALELPISYKYLTVNAAYYPMTVIANITLGKHPYCIATNDETNRIYVGVDGGFMVINGETDQVIAEIPLGDDVRALAVNPLTNRIYAGIWGENIAVVDGATNLKVGEIPELVFDSCELAVNPVTNLVYIADWTTFVGVADYVRVYNGGNFQLVTSVALGISTNIERVGVAVNPNTNKVYAMWTGNNSLFMIDGNTHLITKNVVPSYVSETVMVNSYTDYVYVGTAVLDGETLEEVTPNLIGEMKAIDPVHNLLYTVSGNTNLSRLDGSTHGLIDSLKLHWTFWSYIDRAAVNPATSKIYITNYDGNQTCVVAPFADTTAPTGSISINSGATYTASTSVTLSLTYSDVGSGVSQVRYSNDGVWDTEAWEAPAASKAWTLTSGDGTKTVYYQVKDSDGMLSSTYSDTIMLDTTPPTGSVVINGGVASATSTSVTLSLTYSDAGSGISQVRYSNDGVWDTESWEAPAASKAWTLTSGDGTKTVYYQIRNHAGLVSSTYSDTIILDTTVPTGSIVINGGDAFVASRSVTLSLTYVDATSGVSNVRFSNDGVWDTEAWEPTTASKSWTLLSGDGTKTVYYQVKDNAGLTSVTYSDSITLQSPDTTPPTGSVVINGGTATTSSVSVTLTLSATDPESGVTQMRFSNDGSSWSSWEAYAASKSWTLTSGDGTKTVYVQFKNGAGLNSTSYSDSITLQSPDTTPPTGSITINNGAAYTNSTSVTLSLTASDATSGVSQVRFANPSEVWSPWEAPLATKAWTLSVGDGYALVWYEIKDNAGLVTTLNDSITVDMTLPVANAGQNQNVTMGTSVAFNGGGSTDDRGIESYLWDFGDGSTGSGVAPTHTYSSVGMFSVSLMVRDVAGNSAARSATVTVEVIISEFPSNLLMVLIVMSLSAGALARALKGKTRETSPSCECSKLIIMLLRL